MKKILIALLLTPLSAFAADVYHYNPIEGCSLRKASNGSWQVVQPSEVGQENFTIITSKANAAFSNFKFQGVWYAAKTECFQISDGVPPTADDLTQSGPHTRFTIQKGKFFVEPKLALFFMSGGGTGGGTVNGVLIDKYSPSIGIAAKFGFYSSDHSDFYLEFAPFKGSRNSTTELIKDSLFSLNFGYQYFLSSKSEWHTYLAGALSYNKLSQVVTNGGVVTNYSGSGIGFMVEGGTLWELSSSFGLTGALNYTIASFGTLVDDATKQEITNGISYSRIGVNVGVRYNF